MLTARTTELELMEGWFDSDPEHAREVLGFAPQDAAEDHR